MESGKIPGAGASRDLPALDRPSPRWVTVQTAEGKVVVEFSEPKRPRVIALEDSTSGEPLWSPDGRWLLFRSLDAEQNASLRLASAPRFVVQHEHEAARDIVLSTARFLFPNRVLFPIDEEHEQYVSLDLEDGSVESFGTVVPRATSAPPEWQSGFIEAQLERLEDRTIRVYRWVGEGRAAIVLPSSKETFLSPDASRIALVNPGGPLDSSELDSHAVFSVAVPEQDPSVPFCDNHHTCDIALGSPTVRTALFPRDGWIALAVRWPDVSTLSGTRKGRLDVFLSSSPSLDVITQQPAFSAYSEDAYSLFSTWTVSTDLRAYFLERVGDGDDAVTRLGEVIEGSGTRIIFETAGTPHVLGSNQDHSVLSVVSVQRTGDDLGRFVHVLTPEGSQWAVHELLSNAPSDYYGDFVQHQPNGDAVLFSRPPSCQSNCADFWEPTFARGDVHGYSLFERGADGSYELTQHGDGSARFTPDGQGLLLIAEGILYFIALEQPEHRYPLAEADDLQDDVSVPPTWPKP